MVNIEIISEKPISMINAKELLAQIKKRDNELNFRSEKTEQYLNSLISLKEKAAEQLKKELEDLNIQRLKEKAIAKLIDVLPTDLDSLKAILSGENLSLKEEDLTKIITVVKKYA